MILDWVSAFGIGESLKFHIKTDVHVLQTMAFVMLFEYFQNLHFHVATVDFWDVWCTY